MHKIKALILTHFEIGKLGENSFGEAGLFYDELFKDAEIITTKAGYKFYVKGDLALAVTGSGKVNTSICLASILADENFDFEYVISVGCAGGSYEKTTLGDIVIGTDVYDFDLGHESHDFLDSPIWFHEPAYDDVSYKKLNIGAYERAYKAAKHIKLETTVAAQKAMHDNNLIEREPIVLKGAISSGDNFWKGKKDHQKAKAQGEAYGATEEYSACEMEDIAACNVCEKFGKADNFLAIRAVVNMDIFMCGETPETLWTASNFNDKIKADNEETLDIFEPAMRNLFNVTKAIIEDLRLYES